MLDEKAKRKPGFDEDESCPVTFGDGQDWFLPRPTVDIFVRFGPKAVEVTESSFGAEFDAMLRAATAAAEDGTGFMAAVGTLARDLLLRNYDLADDDLPALLRFRANDAESRLWIGGVLAVANGHDAPKATAGGSGSPSA